MCKRLCKKYEQRSDISLTRYMFDLYKISNIHKRSPDETWLQNPAWKNQGTSDWTLIRKNSNRVSKTTAEELEPDWFLELGLWRSFLTCSILDRDSAQLRELYVHLEPVMWRILSRIKQCLLFASIHGILNSNKTTMSSSYFTIPFLQGNSKDIKSSSCWEPGKFRNLALNIPHSCRSVWNMTRGVWGWMKRPMQREESSHWMNCPKHWA